MSCVTTPAREPALTTDRADLVIATFTYNTDRETRIDFSRAYYKATGRLLVRNSGSLQSLRDMAGKTIATTTGSVYDRWIKNCYKDTKLIVTDSFTNALLAFRDGRADALMFDDTIVLGIAVTDPTLKLTDDSSCAQPYGIGIKQGNTALKAWVDSRLERDEEAGSVPADPEEHGAAEAGRAVLEEHPEAEADVRLQPGRHHDGVLVASAAIGTRRGAAADAAAPSSSMSAVLAALDLSLPADVWNYLVNVWDYVRDYDELSPGSGERSSCRRSQSSERSSSGLCSALPARTAFRSMSQLAAIYVEVIRNTPILVQIFFLYFGLPGDRAVARHPARGVHGRLARRDDLGRSVQHGELPRGLRGGPGALSRSRASHSGSAGWRRS